MIDPIWGVSKVTWENHGNRNSFCTDFSELALQIAEILVILNLHHI
jgi:hypothetical protein